MSALVCRCPRRLPSSVEEVSVDRLTDDTGAAGRPPWQVYKAPELLIAGSVRLDDRLAVARMARISASEYSDLALLGEAIRECGDSWLPNLVGDYGFVCYIPTQRQLLAARDPFGAKLLFWREGPGVLEFASSAAALANGDHYNAEYIADFLVSAEGNSEHTIYEGVFAVAPGVLLTWDHENLARKALWSPEWFEPLERMSADDAINQFRELFRSAVAATLQRSVRPWLLLSGGVDSSSVATMAHRLERTHPGTVRLDGTLTVVDRLGRGDERKYSQLVLDACELRNEEIVDLWPFRDDGEPPPPTDEPDRFYAFYARDRRMQSILRGAGCNVLLSGHGADHYLGGTPYYMADALRNGDIAQLWIDMVAWAVAQRQSLWATGYRYAIHPLLPAAVRGTLTRRRKRLPPPWIADTFSRRFQLDRRMFWQRELSAPLWSLFARAVAAQCSTVAMHSTRNLEAAGVEVRYPFLYRPLVEFGLRLPARLRVRPPLSKWVLREAMADVLPGPIRSRVGKGGPGAMFRWALRHEAKRLTTLLGAPILGELGYVNTPALRIATSRAPTHRSISTAPLLSTLSLELWLQSRSGRQIGSSRRLASVAQGDT
jgi:asparagine synthase (glutamine-hydrolysing)